MAPIDKHLRYTPDEISFFDSYELDRGIMLAFNRIYQSSWPSFGDGYDISNFIAVNICINGRCDVSLGNGKHTIVTKDYLAISTDAPDKDFYYPGKLYEGIALYFDIEKLSADKNNYLAFSGVDIASFKDYFCGKSGLYLQKTNEKIMDAVNSLWILKDDADAGKCRFYTLKLLYEIMTLPQSSTPAAFFTKGQLAIVKKAEMIAVQDLSVKHPAREFAEMFGISESSFKLYFKGVFGCSYMNYFKEKRMKKAAELLKETPMKVAEIASSVGYDNQGKFARAFYSVYGVSPLEYRRLSRE